MLCYSVKLIYIFNAIPIKTSAQFFRFPKDNFQLHVEKQRNKQTKKQDI